MLLPITFRCRETAPALSESFLLFLLSPHVGPNNKLLDGEVENQWSNCGVKYSAGQELVGQVNREEIRLARSV